MKPMILALVVSALLFTPLLVGTAAAKGPNNDSPPGDLGVQLADMFAAMSDVLAAHQDQVANDSYLSSAAWRHRLHRAVFHAPDISIRGASPFAEGWSGDD